MIYYCPMSEEWQDDDDLEFAVGMTPEGDGEDLIQCFRTQKEFWEWYYQ